MYLTRLIYASTVVSSEHSNIIENILVVAKENNTKSGITGILTFNSNYFLQALEGSRTEVNALFTRISKDPRHSNIIILEYSEISERSFSEWSMNYVPILPEYKNIIIKYSQKDTFTPYKLTGKSAILLVTELRHYVEKRKKSDTDS